MAVSFGNSWFFCRATNLFDANTFPTAPLEPYVRLREASDDVESSVGSVESPVPGIEDAGSIVLVGSMAFSVDDIGSEMVVVMVSVGTGYIFIDVTNEVVPLCDGRELLSDRQ